MLRYFRSDLKTQFEEPELEAAVQNDWVIPGWGADDLEIDETRCGIKGSPTRVHKIKNIIFEFFKNMVISN